MAMSSISHYPKVQFNPEIDIRPWSGCSGTNCQHPACVAKRKHESEILKQKIKSMSAPSAGERRTARLKLKRLRKKGE